MFDSVWRSYIFGVAYRCIPFLIILACSQPETIGPRPVGSTSTDQGWLVPKNQVLDGGPGKDGIPSIDAPNFTRASEVDYIPDDDLVLIMQVDGEVKAYPHDILDWHEIVNDRLNGLSYAVTYCPLTGTGIGWDRLVQGEETTFGVSGLLYNSNLMPYDRYTESTWSQQRLDCVHGTLLGSPIITHSMIETSFATFRLAYPNGDVLNLNTGFDREYGEYPYGRYLQHNELLFPVTTEDDRLHLKERTLGVFVGHSHKRVYRFGQVDSGTQLLLDTLDDTELVLIRDGMHNYLVAFETHGRQLELVEQTFPIILQDSMGNTYDILGRVVNNVSDVEPLSLPTQFIGYWFSWGTFYPGIELSDW